MDSTSVILDASLPDVETRWERLRQTTETDDPFTNLRLIVELARLQQLEAKTVFVCADGRDIAGIVATSRKIGPFLDCVPPKLVPTTPLLIAAGAAGYLKGRNVIRLLGDIVLNHAHRVTIVSRDPDVLEAADGQWQADTLETYVIDLQELGENVTERWSAGTRRTFRKNEDRLRVTEDPLAAQFAIELCAESYSRSGRSLGVDTNGLQQLVLNPPEGISTTVFAVRNESERVAGALVILSAGDTAYYWIAGSPPGPAMTVLIGHALARLRSLGLKKFDFLGANVPSIAEFKRRFGPRLEPYTQMRASRSRTLDGLIAARESLRRILGS